MIPKRIHRSHLLKATQIIDREGVPKRRGSRKYNIIVNGRQYPPKYLINIAAKLATGKELDHLTYNGGKEANEFLRARGFSITDKTGKIISAP